MTNFDKITRNKCEDYILFLWHEIFECNKVREKTGKTCAYLDNHIAFCSRLLLEQLLSYIEEPNKRYPNQCYYKNSNRKYTSDDDICFKEFYNKHKDYRNWRLAHYDNVAIEEPHTTIEDIAKIIFRLFQTSIDGDDYGIIEYHKAGLNRIIEISEKDSKC